MAKFEVLSVGDQDVVMRTAAGNEVTLPKASLGGAELSEGMSIDPLEARRSAAQAQPQADIGGGGNAAQREAFQFFREKGWSPVQAAGIVGRLVQESGPNLNPKALGDQGTAHGVAQWRGARWSMVQNFAKENGLDPRDRRAQLAAVDWEIRNRETTARDALMGAENIRDASKAMMHYERPRGYTPQTPEKGHGFANTVKNAAGLLNVKSGAMKKTSNTTSSGGGGGAPESTSEPGGGTGSGGQSEIEILGDISMGDLGLDQTIDMDMPTTAGDIDLGEGDDPNAKRLAEGFGVGFEEDLLENAQDAQARSQRAHKGLQQRRQRAFQSQQGNLPRLPTIEELFGGKA